MPALIANEASHQHTWQLDPITPGMGLGALHADWEQLLLRLHGPHPLLDVEFVDRLLRHFPVPDLYIASWLVNGHVRGMLLLQRGRVGTGQWRSYLPSQAQIGLYLLPFEAPLSQLFAQLPGHAGQIDLLCNDAAFGDLRGPHDPSRFTQAHALTMCVDLQSGSDAYWASRAPKLLSNLRRYERKALAYCPDLALRRTDAPEEIAAAVERYGRLETQGWKGKEGSAMAPDSAQFGFYLDLMLKAAAEGQARVYELWAGDELLASRLLLIQPSMVVCLKTSFNEAHQEFAPGRILLKRVLEALFAEPPAPRVEFYTDANADQLAWASDQRWIYHVEVFRSPLTAKWRRSMRRLRPHLPSRQPLHPVQPRIAVDRYAPDALPDDVSRLMARRGEARHIELGASWFALLARTVFAGHTGMHIYVLRHASKPVAVLPTLREGHELCGLANYYSAYFEPVLADGVDAHELQPLIEAIRGQARSASQYRFWPMDPAHKSFVALSQAMRLAGLKPYPFFCFGNWFLEVPASWDAYLKSRTANMRSTIKRMGKRLEAEAGSLTVCTGGSDLQRHMDAYQAVYASSWKVVEPYPQFVTGLVDLCAQQDGLRLGVAWLGDKPIAAQIWYVVSKRASIFKVAYDENYKSIGPGHSLTAKLMEHVIEKDQVTEVDFLIGDDAYKQSWMSHRRERWGLVAYDPAHPRGLLCWGRHLLAGQLKRRLSPKWLARLRGHREAGDTVSD
jgi:hypothetical protein